MSKSEIERLLWEVKKDLDHLWEYESCYWDVVDARQNLTEALSLLEKMALDYNAGFDVGYIEGFAHHERISKNADGSPVSNDVVVFEEMLDRLTLDQCIALSSILLNKKISSDALKDRCPLCLRGFTSNPEPPAESCAHPPEHIRPADMDKNEGYGGYVCGLCGERVDNLVNRPPVEHPQACYICGKVGNRTKMVALEQRSTDWAGWAHPGCLPGPAKEPDIEWLVEVAIRACYHEGYTDPRLCMKDAVVAILMEMDRMPEEGE